METSVLRLGIGAITAQSFGKCEHIYVVKFQTPYAFLADGKKTTAVKVKRVIEKKKKNLVSLQ